MRGCPVRLSITSSGMGKRQVVRECPIPLSINHRRSVVHSDTQKVGAGDGREIYFLL